jgi:tetratricopeptide (TPR) repeat protein
MRRHSWIAVVSVLAAVGSAAASGAGGNERTLRQAIGYAQRGAESLQKGNVASALKDFNLALEKEPRLPEGHLGLGHVAMREKRFEDALREYRLAQQGHREIASLVLLVQADRYAKSRDQLDRLRETENQLDSESRRMEVRGGGLSSGSSGSLSVGQLERQRVEVNHQIQTLEAMKTPGESTANEPPATLYFFEGNALFDLKRTDEAIAAWEKAASRDPKFAPVQNNLAVAYWMKGRVDDARAAVARAETLRFAVNPSFRADLDRAVASDAALRR